MVETGGVEKCRANLKLGLLRVNFDATRKGVKSNANIEKILHITSMNCKICRLNVRIMIENDEENDVKYFKMNLYLYVSIGAISMGIIRSFY